MSLISHFLCAWFAFLLPCYSTWKTLSHRPISEPEMEKWAMYWTVIGAFVAFEYVAEWFISWLPFYWEVKTVLLLFLSLPQTQGSTYIYQTYLHPYFSQNEADLDAGIVALQSNVLGFVTSHLSQLWDAVLKIANKAPVPQSDSQPGSQPPSQPSMANPLGLARGLWDSYGPFVTGAMQRYSHPSQPLQPSAPSAPPTPSGQSSAYARPPLSPYNLSPTPSSHSTIPPPFPEPQIYRD